MLTLRGGLMACRADWDQCRAQHIAPKLLDAEQIGTDWKTRCPVCGHKTFRVFHADSPRLRNTWGCACKPRHCDGGTMRAELLRLGIPPGCLGDYAIDLKPAADPIAVARLREAVDVILAWPGMDAAEIRVALAEARGDKIPDEYREFARFAQQIGVGRRNSYNLAEKHCRPSGCPPPPGEGSANAKS